MFVTCHFLPNLMKWAVVLLLLQVLHVWATPLPEVVVIYDDYVLRAEALPDGSEDAFRAVHLSNDTENILSAVTKQKEENSFLLQKPGSFSFALSDNAVTINNITVALVLPEVELQEAYKGAVLSSQHFELFDFRTAGTRYCNAVLLSDSKMVVWFCPEEETKIFPKVSTRMDPPCCSEVNVNIVLVSDCLCVLGNYEPTANSLTIRAAVTGVDILPIVANDFLVSFGSLTTSGDSMYNP